MVLVPFYYRRLLVRHREWRRQEQARAVAHYVATRISPLRMQRVPQVKVDEEYWEESLRQAVLFALRREDGRRGRLRIQHRIHERPDPVILSAVRRVYGGVADSVSRAMVPIEIWFSERSVRFRSAESVESAGTMIWDSHDVGPIGLLWQTFLNGLAGRSGSPRMVCLV